MRAHISLNVKNMKESVDFYTKLFGKEPQKQTEDYAKFDLLSPPLNFSMQSTPSGDISHVSHFGIEVDSPSEVEKWRKRSEKTGLTGRSKEKTACCYALQNKVWFKDPDGNSSEIFHVLEQLPVSGPIKAQGSCCAPSDPSAINSHCCP